MLKSEARSLLGLKTGYSAEELAKAERKALRMSHPDMPTGSQEKFIEVKEAIDILKKALQEGSVRVFRFDGSPLKVKLS